MDSHFVPFNDEKVKEISQPPLSPMRLRVDNATGNLKPWQFPGWGKPAVEVPDEQSIQEIQDKLSMEHPKLGQLKSTAICGNDIMSSCLYVSGIVATKSGFLAPVALAIVAFLLYLYRFIYAEVVNAIPLNGGCYNVLLNTTTKRVASVAAGLGILSYIATGVVSATSACLYLKEEIPSVPLVTSTVGLLGIFALLSLLGISESANVAVVMYLAHIATLTVLCIISAIYVINDGFSILKDNFSAPFPDVDFLGSETSGNVFTAIFFGASAAVLGTSGFESSSQFVEEQAPGVFPKTLRNMWVGIAFFNPVISLLSLGVLPLYGDDGILAHKDTVLAKMAHVAWGRSMATIMSIDAIIVLSGAVLTSYVGVIGLMRRLAGDRMLPEMLLSVNKLRGTNHFIIIGYFLVSASLVIILKGKIETLAGVYTYAFLGLMLLFGVGCMLLKFKRPELPRDTSAPWRVCIFGVTMIFLAILGNLLGEPDVLTYFSLYFLAVMVLVSTMFERTFVLRLVLFALQRALPSKYAGVPQSADEDDTPHTGARGGETITRILKEINEIPIFFFCKTPNLSTINKAIMYVRANEQSNIVYIVHCHPKGTPIPEGFPETAALFDHIYLKIQVNFLSVEGQFGPALVEWLSRERKQPKNLMFIAQPSSNFAHTVATLGGVRVITG